MPKPSNPTSAASYEVDQTGLLANPVPASSTAPASAANNAAAGHAPGEPPYTSSLILPLGRGAHGKTTWARWLIDELRNAGTTVSVVDADRTNATLSQFFTDVTIPDSAEDADVENCLRVLTEDMMERPRTAVVDFGANDLTVKRVTRKLGGFNNYLASGGVRGVAVHFFGPDRDDLAYLRDMEDGVFAPPATVLVLNQALLPETASDRLFNPIIKDPIFQAAVERGAQPLFMPRLEVAREVNQRRLGFLAAAAGAPGPDGTRMGPWTRHMIGGWRAAMVENHKLVMGWFR